MKIKLSKSQWEQIGRIAGWIESAKKKKKPCWKGYEMVGTKDKDGKTVPNCVPKKANTKTAGGWGPYPEDLTDVIEAQAVMGHQDGLNINQIFQRIKSDLDLVTLINSYGMTDNELKECLEDSVKIFGR